MSEPINENNTKGIDQYWYRGRPNYVNRPHSNRQVNACKELNRLLERIAELEEFQRLVRTENDQLSDRIEELEKELQTNQQSWQEHDRGRIFSAKEMQLRIAELETLIKVAAGGGQEICPRCNQEMGSPHYCRPDWSGPSIGDKVVSDE